MNPHRFADPAADLEPISTGVQPRLEPIAGIKAVIFDIYGTLVISASGDVGSADPGHHGKSLAQATVAVGLPRVDDADAASNLFRELIGNQQQIARERGTAYPEVNILSVWRDFCGRRFPHESVPTKTLRRLAIEFEIRMNPCCEMPGATATLQSIQQSGRHLGIVSNAQFYTLEMLDGIFARSLNELGFSQDLSFFSYRFGASKPGPEMFDGLLAALSRVGLSADEAIYVGNDMLNDVYGAQQAGLKTALFAGDQRSLRLRETSDLAAGSTPDVVITELEQLQIVLGEKSDNS